MHKIHEFSLQTPGQRLAFCIAEKLNCSRRTIREAIINGLVSCDGTMISDPSFELDEAEHTISVDLRHGSKGQGKAPTQAFKTLYIDEDVIVVDKASGILSAPYESDQHGHLPELIRNYLRKQKIVNKYLGSVHRLDKETSGCIVFALKRNHQQNLLEQFFSHTAERKYRALCGGIPRQATDTITMPLGKGQRGTRWVVKDEKQGKSAVTHFKRLQKFEQSSEIALHLETGRTHQIRIHMAAIGCPVIGDHVYAPRPTKAKDRAKANIPVLPPAPRLMLHAESLAFTHPRTGERIEIEAPLPEVFTQYRTQLENWTAPAKKEPAEKENKPQRKTSPSKNNKKSPKTKSKKTPKKK